MGRRGKRKVLSIVYNCNGFVMTYNCTSNDEFQKTRKENKQKIMENEFLNSKKKLLEIDADNQNHLVGNANDYFFGNNIDEEYYNLNKCFDDDDDEYIELTFNNDDKFFF